jgi:7-cyano-7-deazaguanine synthase
MDDRHLILLSGGIDSVVLAYFAKDKGMNLHEGLFFDYDQDPVNKELYCARRCAINIGFPLQIFDVAGLRKSFSGTFKSDYHLFMAESCNCGDPMAAYGIAATYAVLIGVPKIIVGVHKDDLVNIPNIKEFFNHFNSALSLLHQVKFELITPFIDMSKAEVVKLGKSLKVPFEETWVCYRRQYEHCGECPGCQKRKQAFKTAKIKETIMYLK